MSTLAGITRLEGIDLGGAPPCAVLVARMQRCGKPSAYRALFAACALDCSPAGRIFLCAPCMRQIILYGGRCGTCWEGSKPFLRYC